MDFCARTPRRPATERRPQSSAPWRAAELRKGLSKRVAARTGDGMSCRRTRRQQKGHEFVACKKLLPCPSPFAAQVWSVWKRKRGFLEKVLSPPQKNEYHLPCRPSLPWHRGASYLHGGFSQVATNYTLFIFPGAPCKTPRARCSGTQDAYSHDSSRRVWLAALCDGAACPSGFPRHLHRPWAALSSSQRCVCLALFSSLFFLSSSLSLRPSSLFSPAMHSSFSVLASNKSIKSQ